jgi:RimJ/RimL family protein N-acetyltransferase
VNVEHDRKNTYLAIFEIMKTSFYLQPTLEDEIVILRPLKEEDLDDLYMVASDPLIWEQHPSKDRCRRDVFELFFEDGMASGGAFVVIDKTTGQVIGSTRFHRIDEVENAIEIGWTFLARGYWGGRYNQAMKKLMMDYAFQFVDNILFYIDENNLRSQRAVKKIGGERIMSLAGVTLEVRPDASVIYLITKTNWKEKQVSPL